MAIRHIKIGDTSYDIYDSRIEEIDDELDTQSSNPVENSVIASEFESVSSILENLGTLVSTLASAVESLSSNNATIAWDGDSVPTVANIPAGVTVEYGGNTYEGLLAASASTVGTMYFVGEENGDTWHRYLTQDNNGSYIWVDYGTTDIDLSDYERKDDNVWLTEDEFQALSVKDPTKTYNVYEDTSQL